MAMSPIEKELRTATKLKMDSEETRKQFLKRLTDASLALGTDEWESLSEAAQTWANVGITALNNKEPVPDFDETDDKQEEEEVTSEARTDDETEGKANGEEKKTTKKKSGKKPAAKKAEGKTSAKKEAKTPTKKPAVAKGKDKEDGGKPRKVGAQTRIKQMILDNPEVTTEELITKLGKAGFTPTKLAVSTIRSGFLQSLKLVQEAGFLKGIKV